MKTRTDLYPYDSVPIGFDMVRLEHVELLLTQWWCRSLRQDLRLAIPSDWLLPVSEVLTFGAVKYSDRGWENDARYHKASDHYAAFMRHLHSERSHDEESGLPNWYHAVTRAVMLATLAQRGVLIDDRPPRSPVTAALMAEAESEFLEASGYRPTDGAN